MKAKPAIDNLPCAPLVLLRALEALQSDSETASIGAIVQQDPIVAGKILSAANTQGNPVTDIPQAVHKLGKDRLYTLLFSRSIRQSCAADALDTSYEPYAQLWRRALRCASFARELAAQANYHAPEQAYLLGLLANVGQFVQLHEYGNTYRNVVLSDGGSQAMLAIEQQICGMDHRDIGAAMVTDWRWSSLLSDAIRYQYETTDRLLDAHQLVKVIHASSMVASADVLSPTIIRNIDCLFGIGEFLVQKAYASSLIHLDGLTGSLGMSSAEAFYDAQKQLASHVAELGELAQINTLIHRTQSASALISALQQSLSISVGIDRAVLFTYDEANHQLISYRSAGEEGEQCGEFRLRPAAGKNLVSDALLQAKPVHSAGDTPTAVIDDQLLRYCRGDLLHCLPLSCNGETLGVLVFATVGAGLGNVHQRSQLLRGLCTTVAQSLAGPVRECHDNKAVAAMYQQKIREAVHEAGNPLSITRNYLETLKLELDSNHVAQNSLNLVTEEISRVADILKQLREADALPTKADVETMLDVNRTIEDTAQLVRASIGISKNLTFQLHLSKQMENVRGSANHLKQVLTNLLKNAAEALVDEGGQIRVSSDASVSLNGHDFIAIIIADDGPGIPAQTMNALYCPVQSSKGSGHSGLGLNIVKKLIDGMGGSIICRTGEHGTEFQILLPVVREPES